MYVCMYVIYVIIIIMILMCNNIIIINVWIIIKW